MEVKKLKNAFHNDSLQMFNELMFKDVLTIENVVSKKRSVKAGDGKYYGYFLEKAGQTYFLEDFPENNKSVLDILPIKVKERFETDYNKLVFYFIIKYTSVKIPTTKAMPFRELIDTLANFEHTNPKHFILYKLMVVAGYTDRINYRVIGERGFGKDCVINNVRDMVGSLANIYGATFAKLEYSLKHKFLIFNEMGNLKSEDKYSMQQFLLAIGAFFNKYIKRSRATEDTQEEYDISKTSLSILYNPPLYYIEKGQEFFDTIFTKAVLNRFIPFYFEGMLNEKFDAEFDVEGVVRTNMETYKKVISTIRYYRETIVMNKYLIPDDIVFDETTRRYERSFLKIADYISEYANDEKEYYELLYELYSCYKKYDDVLAEALSGQGS